MSALNQLTRPETVNASKGLGPVPLESESIPNGRTDKPVKTPEKGSVLVPSIVPMATVQ